WTGKERLHVIRICSSLQSAVRSPPCFGMLAGVQERILEHPTKFQIHRGDGEFRRGGAEKKAEDLCESLRSSAVFRRSNLDPGRFIAEDQRAAFSDAGPL